MKNNYLPQALVKTIKYSLHSQTIRDSFLVFSGNFCSKLILAIGSIFLIRILTPEEYGIFSTSQAVMFFFSGVFFSGLNLGLIRFASKYFKTDSENAWKLLKKIFQIELFYGLIFLIIGIFFANSISELIFNKPNLGYYFKLAFFGSFWFMIFQYFQSFFKARLNFLNLSILNILRAISFFLGLLISYLLLTGFDVKIALLVMIFSYFFAVSAGVIFTYKKLFHINSSGEYNLNTFFHYCKWLILSSIFIWFFSRLDIFMLTRLQEMEVVGIYGVAFKLYSLILLFLTSINSVLLPKISRKDDLKYLRSFIPRSLKYTLILSFLLMPLLLFSKPILIYIVGEDYSGSIILFQLFIMGALISLNLNPITNIIYVINKTKLLAITNFIQLTANFLGNLYMIPLYGALGATIVTILTHMLGNILLVLFILYYFKSH